MSELMKRTMQNMTIASEVPNFASASASKVHQNYIRVPVLLLEEGRQLQEQYIHVPSLSGAWQALLPEIH